jgi:poly(glycerol-phosphate) alpha-glucosyltransferase
MSVLEAWSYRLPVLMTDECNLPEGFAANAALRIGTDVDSIAEGLRELFSLPTTDNGQPTTSLAYLGDNGVQLVSERFTWQMIAAQMKEVYEWVIGGGTPPSCVVKR